MATACDRDPASIPVWGVPFSPLTLSQTVDRIEQLIERGNPCYAVTANLHYAMLADASPRLREVNERAALILADGMPLVWASRLQGTPLPERVAGSDLIWRLCEHAAKQKHRLFLLGGAPGIADSAAKKLLERFPEIAIAGTASPPFRALSRDEHQNLLQAIRDSRPHILIVALGQPKGELWIAENYEQLNVPFSIQLGASIDFVAGSVRRAPRWIQRIGFEWAFRLALEPSRLAGRYARNFRFMVRMLFGKTRPHRCVQQPGRMRTKRGECLSPAD
jgi:N-acetylglucosaminyldiphosphoundecaprenol N-acetyl-beta-D-mannosaminyltransferase